MGVPGLTRIFHTRRGESRPSAGRDGALRRPRAERARNKGCIQPRRQPADGMFSPPAQTRAGTPQRGVPTWIEVWNVPAKELPPFPQWPPVQTNWRIRVHWV